MYHRKDAGRKDLYIIRPADPAGGVSRTAIPGPFPTAANFRQLLLNLSIDTIIGCGHDDPVDFRCIC